MPLDWTGQVPGNAFDFGPRVTRIEDDCLDIAAQHEVSMYVGLDVVDVVLVNRARDGSCIPRHPCQVAFQSNAEVGRLEGAVGVAERRPEQSFSLEPQMDGAESWSSARCSSTKIQGTVLWSLIDGRPVIGGPKDFLLPQPPSSTRVGRGITTSDAGLELVAIQPLSRHFCEDGRPSDCDLRVEVDRHTHAVI